MSCQDFDPIREILFQMEARYATIRPTGLVLGPPDAPGPPRRSVKARILNHGGARTLYRRRQPLCRSLDGVKAMDQAGKRCQTCQDRPRCTPQVRVDLLVDAQPYRLLLAYTSAKNFLMYAAELRARGLDVHDVTTRLVVLNRGTWGELTLSALEASSQRR